jgi:hypothetical protein
MEWVASTLHTTSEHGVSSITTADAHNSAASSRLNWRPCRFKWTRPFRRKTKSGFCACAITPRMRERGGTHRTGVWLSRNLRPPAELFPRKVQSQTHTSPFYKKVVQLSFDVKNDIGNTKIVNWRRVTQDRDGWKRATREVLIHHG